MERAPKCVKRVHDRHFLEPAQPLRAAEFGFRVAGATAAFPTAGRTGHVSSTIYRLAENAACNAPQ